MVLVKKTVVLNKNKKAVPKIALFRKRGKIMAKKKIMAVKSRRFVKSKRVFKRRERSPYKSYYRKRYDRRAGKGIESSEVDRGWSRSLIKASETDNTARVLRTYTSATVYSISNTATIPYVGEGLSLHFSYDIPNDSADARVYQGAPQGGIGTDTGVVFQNLANEFQAMTNVFRYFRVTKFQASVQKLPMPVYLPSQAVPTVPTNQQQGGTWTGMGDPGRFLMRPWSGQPGDVDYKTGALTSTLWDDHDRYKIKKVDSIIERGGPSAPMKYSVTPVQPVFIPDTSSPISPTTGNLRYTATPAIDIFDFQSGNTDAGSYGLIYYWYFPACVNATSGFLATDMEFELEIEYFGLRRPNTLTPAPPPLADGQVYGNSKEYLIAALTGQQVQRVDCPKKVKQICKNIDESKEYEIPDLKRQDTNQQASVPNLSKPKIGPTLTVPQSRPPTPTRSK